MTQCIIIRINNSKVGPDEIGLWISLWTCPRGFFFKVYSFRQLELFLMLSAGWAGCLLNTLDSKMFQRASVFCSLNVKALWNIFMNSYFIKTPWLYLASSLPQSRDLQVTFGVSLVCVYNGSRLDGRKVLYCHMLALCPYISEPM